MPARGTIFQIRARCFLVAGLLLAEAWGVDGANLGPNPSLSSGSQTLNPSNYFTGTFSISGSATLNLSGNYTTPNSTTFAFSGAGSTVLSYSGGGPFTLSLPTGTAFTRSGGAGST